MVVPRLIILVWLTTFVLFDSIKFELVCSFDKHAVYFMISAPVAEHQLLVFLVGQPRTIFRPLRKKFSFPGFFIILFFLPPVFRLPMPVFSIICWGYTP
jgi:hypothetical protein